MISYILLYVQDNVMKDLHLLGKYIEDMKDVLNRVPIHSIYISTFTATQVRIF